MFINQVSNVIKAELQLYTMGVFYIFLHLILISDPVFQNITYNPHFI